ncbi:MAG TPA: hypothetical protein PLR85_19140, partial [Nitrospira sp.]|nr:hypothetical protein [Nitrospira sp.]
VLTRLSGFKAIEGLYGRESSESGQYGSTALLPTTDFLLEQRFEEIGKSLLSLNGVASENGK